MIAAIHGTALGGGFEVSLACHYRCAIASAKVGLPEVKLGLLPGAGGTQRVPRLAGVKAALDMITGGNPISAAKAKDMGLIDEVLTGEDVESSAIAYAQELQRTAAPLKRVRDITIDPATVEAGFFDEARARLAKRARGQIAQDRIVSCLEAAVSLPMDEGLARERELFGELVTSPESAAMRHILRGAYGCQDQGPAEGYGHQRHQESGHYRWWHNGWRHRHVLCRSGHTGGAG